MFKNKILMITGGTGSFGQAVLNRFLATDVDEIRIFSRDEKKQEEMRLKYNHKKLKFYLGDVRSHESLLHSTKGVDYIFHAAALKQVPSCEFYPMEAFRTNVNGTENVMNAATANGVKRLIILSTDKAVYPINAMGISKAMAEKLMTAKARSQNINETILCATRYGNVMASRGSVIPLFVSQIKNGKSITVTDPNMTRFLMSLEESVNLVLHAFEHGNQGDIFVQKSPAATVADLAQSLKEIFNHTALINIIGTRHGEKLYESLISREEMSKAIDMGNYYRIPSDNRSLNYDQYFSEGEAKLSEMYDYTSHNTKRLNVGEIKNLLLSLDYIKGELNA
jgi:UDP-N-acetylglucosamine 4,6-dehydratase